MKRIELKKKVMRHIKDLEKRGIDISSVTKGKSIDQLSWSQKTYDAFMRMKGIALERVRDRKKELLNTKKEFKKILDTQIKKSGVNKDSERVFKSPDFAKQFPQFEKNVSKIDNVKEVKEHINKIKENPFSDIASKITKELGKDFLKNRYFKELMFEDDAQKRIDKMIDSFGNNISDLKDFIDYTASQQYKYHYTDEYGDMIDVDNNATDYNNMMNYRLKTFEDIIKYKKYK